jgi:hypothetical protein
VQLLVRNWNADTSGMQSFTSHEAPAPSRAAHLRIKQDRRAVADRRSAWRGGRRDGDWLGRPSGPMPDTMPRVSLVRFRTFISSLW